MTQDLPSLKQYRGFKPVEYFNARTIDEAIYLLNRYPEQARIIAGGTDLVRLIKSEIIATAVLVNIKTIAGMADIVENDDGLMIGALTRIKDIASSSIIKSKYPLLAQAAYSVASPNIRNMATVAGNLCQEVNCWYYRRPAITGISFFCHRKGGNQCFAIAGDNRYHAIFGARKCFAACPSDLALALSALESKVTIIGPDGNREVSPEDLYTETGNILKPNEIITEIRIPALSPGTKQKYLKFRTRRTIDFAISSVATIITMEDGTISKARVVLGGVAPTPYRSLKAEKQLEGKAINDTVAQAVAKEALSQARPLNMNAYKVPLTEALVKRAILE